MRIVSSGLLSATVELSIPFFDVDSMGITWHGNYIKYFELARCELLKKIDYDYSAMQASGYGWPVVDMRVKYCKPTRFKQEIVINAFLIEYENRLKINYLIFDKHTQEKLTMAYSIQVAINLTTRQLCFASPNILLEKLSAFL